MSISYKQVIYPQKERGGLNRGLLPTVAAKNLHFYVCGNDATTLTIRHGGRARTISSVYINRGCEEEEPQKAK